MKTLTPLNTWLAETEGMPLYAVIASTGQSGALGEYYHYDGSRTPLGLYAETPYADWFSVMPMLVQISPNSEFLDWVRETQHKDWGWLARSPLALNSLLGHLRGLTQVTMPNGKSVFFRYWDGQYFPAHIRFMGDAWNEILPVFSDYWINGEAFTCKVIPEARAPEFPWWQVPQALLDSMLDDNPAPMVTSLLLSIRKQRPDLTNNVPEELIRRKIQQAYLRVRHTTKDALKDVIALMEER